MLAGLEPGQQRGEQERVAKAGLRPPPGAHGAQRPVARLDRAADRGEALGVRVEHAARPVGRGNRAGDEVRGRDRVRPSTSGSSCAASAATVSASVAAVDDDRQAPLGDPRRDVDVELERRRADLREPEAELLDEVEREPVAARRLRRPQERLQLDLLAGRDRPLEARRAGRPRRSRCRGRRASGRRAARRSRRASATSPCRRSGARRARARRARPELRQLVAEPPNRERADRNGMLADSLHAAG